MVGINNVKYIPFNVQEPYKTFLLRWEKTVEWRLNKGKFVSLRVWSLLQFDDAWELLEVEKVTFYEDFRSMFECEGLKSLVPWISSIEEGIAIYRQFYTLEQEKEFWVLAFQVRVVEV